MVLISLGFTRFLRTVHSEAARLFEHRTIAIEIVRRSAFRTSFGTAAQVVAAAGAVPELGAGCCNLVLSC
jgi:hypothetical protein